MLLNAIEKQQLDKVLQQPRQPIHAKNKTLEKFAKQGYGRIIGKHIHYSEQDFDGLQQLIAGQQFELGKATHQPNSQSSRYDVAKTNINEKSAQAVFANQLLVVGMGCEIPLFDPLAKSSYTMPATPVGVLTTIAMEFLDIQRLKRVIVIENGQLMTHWWLWQQLLPCEWQHSVLLYRGHSDNIAKLKRQLQQLPQDCDVGLFFDYDIAGLRMIAEYQAICPLHTYAFLPHNFVQTPSKNLLIPKYNKQQQAIEQLEKNKYLISSISSVLQADYDVMATHLLALTQEHLTQDEQITWRMQPLF